MKKIFTLLAAALMSAGIFAEPIQQNLSVDINDWTGVDANIAVDQQSGWLTCTTTAAQGGMELRWNPMVDLSEWDKIVVVVESMNNCSGTYYRVFSYLRDVSERTDIQKQGQVSTKLPENERAMITMDLRTASVFGTFDLAQVKVLGIQSQVAGSEFAISRIYLEKENIPFDPEGTLNFVELTADMISAWENDETIFSEADLPGFGKVTLEQAQTWTPTDTEVTSLLYYQFEESRAVRYLNSFKGQTPNAGGSVLRRKEIYQNIQWGYKLYYTTGYTNSGGATAVGEAQVDKAKAKKFFRDNNVFIEKNGETFTLTGAKVK